MEHQLIPLSDGERWEAALDGIACTFSHTLRYNRALSLTTGRPGWLYVGTSGTERLVCPFSERADGFGRDLVTPYGNGGFTGSGRFPDFWESLSAFMRDQDVVCAYVGLSQVFDWLPPIPANQLFHHNTMYVIDLTPSLADLKQGIGHNNRRHLRRWRESGARIVDDQVSLKERLIEAYPDFARRMGAGPDYRFGEETFRALFEGEGVLLLGAEFAGHLEAVRLFLHTPACADAFVEAHIGEGGRRHSRGLYWEGIRRFKERGVLRLNIGGGMKEGDSLAFFKKGFGGEARPQVGVKAVFDRNRYVALCEAAGVGTDPSGFFPPYRA